MLLAMPSGSVHRLLFVAPFAPRLDGMHGGSRVIAQLIAALGRRHTVGVIYLRAPGEPAIDGLLARSCDLIVEVPRMWETSASRWRRALRLGAGLATGTPMWARRWWVPECHDAVRTATERWRPDIVQFEFHIMGQYAAAAADFGVPRILVEHEPGTSAAADRVSAFRGLARRVAVADHQAWRGFERRILRQFDRIVAFTRRDALSIGSLAGGVPIVRIPFGIELPASPLDPIGHGPPTVLFLGSFAHYPNEDAAVRLASSILPLVHRRRREVVVSLIGTKPTRRLLSCVGPSVLLDVAVPDVTPYLDRAAVVAAPLRFGGGMRVKVLEALAAGKATVCSPLAVEGLGVRHGEQVCLAETDAEFAGGIVELIEHPDRRRDLGRRAREWALIHADIDRPAVAYEQLYESVRAFPPRSNDTAALSDRTETAAPLRL